MPTRAERERHGNSNTDYDILAYRYTVTELVRVSDMAGMVGGEWEESGSRVGSERASGRVGIGGVGGYRDTDTKIE